MHSIANTLRDLSVIVCTNKDGGRPAFIFNEFKKKCIRRATQGETSTQLYESLRDHSDEEVTKIGTEILRLINEAEFKVVSYDDTDKVIDIVVSWR